MTLLRARVLITLKRADIAWLAILAIVLAVDLTAPESTHTLSYRLGEYQPRTLWRAVVVLTALHLIRLLPPWCDFWSALWMVDRKLRPRIARHSARC